MRRISGSVWIYGVVDANGRIKDQKAVASPSDSLTATSLSAVKQMQFSPATCDGVAVDFEQFTTINFTLGN
jgi:TonB family protein